MHCCLGHADDKHARAPSRIDATAAVDGPTFAVAAVQHSVDAAVAAGAVSAVAAGAVSAGASVDAAGAAGAVSAGAAVY